MPESLAEIANEMERTYITNDSMVPGQEPWWGAVADVDSLSTAGGTHRWLRLLPIRAQGRSGRADREKPDAAGERSSVDTALTAVFDHRRVGRHGALVAGGGIGTAAPCSPRRSAISSPTSDAASSPPTRHRFAKRFADTYHYLFEVTRFVDFIRWVSPPPAANEQGLRPTLHKIYQPTRNS